MVVPTKRKPRRFRSLLKASDSGLRVGSCAQSVHRFCFGVSFTKESVARGASYNFRAVEGEQLDPAQLPYELPGMSAFAREGDVVYHTYSAYTRGLDALWNMWQWLDRAPRGRNEGDYSWFHRRDEYTPVIAATSGATDDARSRSSTSSTTAS